MGSASRLCPSLADWAAVRTSTHRAHSCCHVLRHREHLHCPGPAGSGNRNGDTVPRAIFAHLHARSRTRISRSEVDCAHWPAWTCIRLRMAQMVLVAGFQSVAHVVDRVDTGFAAQKIACRAMAEAAVPLGFLRDSRHQPGCTVKQDANYGGCLRT